MCERCGRRADGERFYVPMKSGVRTIVCAECASFLHSLFGGRGRRVTGTPRDLYPALYERIPPPG